MTTNTPQQQLTLNKIGNFVGLKIREVLDLLSGKADRVEVEALVTLPQADARYLQAGMIIDGGEL